MIFFFLIFFTSPPMPFELSRTNANTSGPGQVQSAYVPILEVINEINALCSSEFISCVDP